MSSGRDALPSTTALRAFEAAARHLSFTAAAVELSLTQGAVSHQIRELESRLSVTLFRREARGIALTEEGKNYLPYVRDAIHGLRAGAQALRPTVASDNVITVSCSPNFAQKWLVPRLGQFLADHPNVDCRISASPQHITFDSDGIDIAIRHGDGSWPELSVTRLCAETIFPVCSPHLEGDPETIQTLTDLHRFPLIHDQQRGGWQSWLRSQRIDLTAFDFNRGPVMSQTSLAIDAAIAFQGVALARSALVDLDIRAGRLLRPLSVHTQADFAYWIVCPVEHLRRQSIMQFRDWLVANALSS